MYVSWGVSKVILFVGKILKESCSDLRHGKVGNFPEWPSLAFGQDRLPPFEMQVDQRIM